MVYLCQMDRELDAVLVLPFITIMAVMIAIFCRLKAVLSVRDKRPKSTLFERENAVRRGFCASIRIPEHSLAAHQILPQKS